MLFDIAELTQRPRYVNEAIVRSLCYNAYLGQDNALCRVLGRYHMFIDTADVGLSSHLLTHGYWEMWHTEAMVDLIKPGMTAVDVGANLGYFTLLMGELVGSEGRVHAFEPNPAIAERLRNSVDINGFGTRSVIHEMALSNSSGEAELIIPRHEPKNGHIVPLRPSTDGTRITTIRLDAVPELLSADFMKIDVEGAEELVWQGMGGLLKSSRPLTVILEFTLGRYKDPKAFIGEMTRYGFTTEVIDPWQGIVPIDQDWLLSRPPAEDQLVVLRR